jgi:hypothetical protein
VPAAATAPPRQAPKRRCSRKWVTNRREDDRHVLWEVGYQADLISIVAIPAMPDEVQTSIISMLQQHTAVVSSPGIQIEQLCPATYLKLATFHVKISK